MKKSLLLSLAASLVLGAASASYAADTIFKAVDPEGDDNGPGNYTYPTDKCFTKGSFDMTSATVEKDGDNFIFTVNVKGRITNPWNSPGGFSVQTVDFYIDMDGVKDSGLTETLGGRYIKIAPESAWEKLVIISPEPKQYPKEIETKSKNIIGKYVCPTTITVKGKSLSISVPAADLFAGLPDNIVKSDPTKWGYVITMTSSEGYPDKDVVRIRQVLQNKAQWRFGGGSDKSDDPNVIDLIIPEGYGFTQADALKWDVGKQAVVPAVYADKIPAAPATK